jgi:hypothetical protein
MSVPDEEPRRVVVARTDMSHQVGYGGGGAAMLGEQ